MARVLQINEICEQALRKIGAYAIQSSGPRAQEMAVARFWLDMLVGHLGARRRTWWLVPSTATFPLVAGTALYDLNAALGIAQAPLGVQFVVGAWLYDPTCSIDIHEIHLMRREEFEEIENKLRPGPPHAAYVDRGERPSMTFFPVPDPSKSYSVRLLFQGYTSDFTAGSANCKAYSLRNTWNLYIVTALAAQLANGPVRKAPADEVADMKKEAMMLLADLEAYDDMEQADEPRRVHYYDGI